MDAISSLQSGTMMPVATTDQKQVSNAQTSATTTTEVTKQVEKSNEKQSKEDLKKQLSTLSEQLNKEMSPLNFNVKFGYNDKLDEMYVSVTEKNTNKLIRKIPSDEAVNLMEKMREIVGMIFDKKA